MRRYFFNRVAVFLSLGLLAFSLSACGSSEETERKAFIEFLQTRVNNQAGLHLPKLTDADKSKFGQYAAHYDLIVQYNDDLGNIMKPAMEEASGLSGLNSPSDVVNKRALINMVRTKMQEHRKQYEARAAKVNADRAALKQPDDLKPVYEAAFKHTVTDPSGLLTRVFASLDELLAQYEAFGAVLEKNKASIKMSGMTFETEDQKVLDEVNEKLADVQKASSNVMQLQSELFKLMR
jgi:hypothetical protein